MTTESKSSIAVIVVNYGTADLSIDAVESVLARQHEGHPVEVHLVDNASPGDDAARFAQAHAERGWGERVTLWLERENHGFGRGNNVVIQALAARAAPPDYFFLLNPDASLENEALAILADFMDTRPQVQAAGARIERPNGSPVAAAFRFPGAGSEFGSTVSFGPVTRLFARYQVAMPADLPRQQVDWVSGAAVMFRLAAVQKAGFFDPDFFLYFEETELMWRLHAQGGEVWFLPEARVGHEAGAATGMQGGRHRSKAQPGYWYDSWRLYHVKTRGVGAARRIALLKFLAGGLNFTLRRLTGRAPNLPLNFRKDFTAHVLKPLFGGEPGLARPDGKTPKAVWLQRQ
ncbi:glycosyltransferase family 2 protein [Paenirhodobacter populi]|uniref:glycosyltransferase family 2 protein n=1 Tax=Paenirhodobacter populi TaxID=2306993 RepID=UPI0013E37726|nr:glycosyltransferase family 2 protein [Sinirhodobacter populi]